MYASTLLLGATLLARALAQPPPDESAVPRNEPIQGDYTGSLRPQLHFSPPSKFMNDPNGLHLAADGTYHMYYQYDPTDIVAGNQHWGHATSRDLYHWTNQKIAIFPDVAGVDAIFSGSAVIDVNNTSGFFPNQTDGVVAIYTKNTAQEQTQDIAYSIDGGYTFSKYSGNPVISINSTEFRDPKVLWYPDTQKWVMVVSYAQDFVLGFYTSSDLKHWDHASNFSHDGLLGQQYECPNLVQLPMNGSSELMWMLAISINPGAPQGGSITQYFPGTFNGTAFTPIDGAARVLDSGKDNYAGQWFYGTPTGQDPISIHWASNWQYSQLVPTGQLEGWRSSMSLPRVNMLANITRLGYDIISRPFNIVGLFDNILINNSSFVNVTSEASYTNVASGAIYFEIAVTNLPPAANVTGTANFTLSSSVSQESVSGGFFFGGDFWINRGKTNGFDNPFFTDKFTISNLDSTDGTWKMEGVVDRSILEIFLNDGQQVATTTFFPDSPLDTITLGTADMPPGVTVSATAWTLNSAWAAKASSNGTVLGNSTNTP